MLDVDAAAIKLEGHYHAGKGSSENKGLMRKLRESIDPGAAEMVYAEKDRIFVRSLKEVAAELVEAGIPPRLAACQAYEIKRGADHLTNIDAVMSYAEDELREDATYALPRASFMDDYIPFVEDVTDEKIQRLFGKILAGEMEAEGSFSRLALSKLSQFSKLEVELIEKLCSVSTGGHSGSGWVLPLPILIGGDKGTDKQSGAITNYELRDLESLGIIKNEMSSTISAADGVFQFCVHGEEYRIVGHDFENIRFKTALLTTVGEQLSKLFEFGTSEGFLDIIKEEWGRQGASIERVV